MKRFTQLTMVTLMFSLLAAPLSAKAPGRSDEGEVVVKPEGYRDILDGKEKAGERALSDEERAVVEKKCLAAKLKAAVKEMEKEGDEAYLSKSLKPKSTLYTSHPGVYHRYSYFSAFFHEVTLHDGSIWEIRKSDRYKVKDWYTSDSLVLLPNNSFFAEPYNFKLYNENLGVEVDVRLLVKPLYNGAYTYWIVAIDRYSQELCLNDGSIWRLSAWDQEKFDQWLVNDTIIIGSNRSFFSLNPNILINVDTNTHVQATCDYY